jgi:hypothetical protein
MLLGKKALKIKVDSKHKFVCLSKATSNSLFLPFTRAEGKVFYSVCFQQKGSRKVSCSLGGEKKAMSANKTSECDTKSIILVTEL